MGLPNRLHHLHNGILSITMILGTDDVSCVCVDRCRSDNKRSRQRTMIPRTRFKDGQGHVSDIRKVMFNPLNPELNPIYLLALLGAHHFLHVSRIRVKLLTFRRLMSYIYIYGAPILDVSRSHTTTQHSR